ncbi:hypothetical protein PG993_008970, partial [Apiospora rasikravindrae]
PHLVVEIPLLKKGADLESTADMAQNRQESLRKGLKNPDVFKVVIDRAYSDTTMNMELHVNSKLAVREEDNSPWAHFSRYLLGFDGISERAMKHKEGQQADAKPAEEQQVDASPLGQLIEKF